MHKPETSPSLALRQRSPAAVRLTIPPRQRSKLSLDIAPRKKDLFDPSGLGCFLFPFLCVYKLSVLA